MASPVRAQSFLSLFTSFLILLIAFAANAQNEVAIGSSTTKSNAILWLNGNGSQGLILPVVTNKSSVANPDKGMIVYDESDNKVWYRNTSIWIEVGGGGTSGGSNETLNLQLTGNQMQLRDGTDVLSTITIAGGTSTNGGFMVFTGGSWQFAQLSGDVTGTNGALTVDRIRGKNIAALPTNTQALVYDPAANSGNGGWTFQALTSGGTVTSISGTAPLTVTNPTTTPTISIANAGITNALIADNAINSAKIADGTITGADISSGTITADKINQSGATNDQVLRWNGTQWEPATLAGSAGTVTQIITGTGLTGGPITNTGTISIAPGGVTSTELADNAVTGAKISAGVIDNSKLAPNAVNSASIADGTVTGADIAALTITSNNIVDNSITASKLAPSGAANGQVLKWNGNAWVPANDDAGTGALPALSTNQLVSNDGTANVAVSLSGDAFFSSPGVLNLTDGAVTTQKITDNAVTNLKVADNAITTAKIQDGTITGADIAATTIATGNMADNAITTTKIAANAVDNTKLADNAVTTTKIAANAVDNSKLADNAITNLKVADNAITTAKIQDATITGADIAATTITADKLADSGAANGQVLKFNGTNWVPAADDAGTGSLPTLASGQLVTNDGTSNVAVTVSGDATFTQTGALTIANNAITDVKLADNAVTTTKIAANAVDNTKLADNAVTTTKIAASAVDNTKLADNAVTNLKVADNAITTTKIQDGTITGADIAATTIATGNIADNAINSAKIQDASITGADIAATTITADKLADSGAANGQVLKFNGTNWVPAADDAGTGSLPTLASGQLVTNDGTSNVAVTVSGDATFTQTGALTIANNAINDVKIADNAVTTTKIAANAVDNTKLTDNAVTTTKISDNAVTNLKVADNAITTTKIQDGTITGADIAATTIATGNLADNAITTTKIAANAVDNTKLADNAVTTTKITDNAVTNLKVADNAITTTKIQDATITGADIAATTITADKLADSGAANGQVLKFNGTNWVPAADDAGAGAVPTLNNGQILVGDGVTNSAAALSGDATLTGGTLTISDNAITTTKINANAVDNTKLADNAVTDVKIADNAVTTTKIAANAVDNTKLADNAVTTTKIAASAVDNTKLADNAVTNLKVADNAITTTKIQDGTITGADIAATTIATGNIADNAINSAKIQDASITGADIAATTITADKLADSGAANGQVLKFNGTNWVPAADDAGAGAVPTLNNGQILVGDGVTNSAAALSGDATLSGGTLTISDNAITTTKINANAVDNTKLADNAVTDVKIADNAVTTTKIAANAVDNTKLADNAVTTTKITDNAVTNLKVADNAITTTKIQDGTIIGADIAATTITGANIANTSITADKLEQSSANTNDVLQWNGTNWVPAALSSGGTVTEILTGTGLTGGPITGTGTISIAAGGVGTTELADNAVTTVKINANAVDNSKLADNAVSETKLADNAVTSAKIADGTIANTDIAASAAIEVSKLAAGTDNQVLTTVAGVPTWSTGASGWSLTGNAGINPATNFIGTTDDQPLRFSTGVGGVERMRIDATGNVGIGTTTPRSKFQIGTVSHLFDVPSFTILSHNMYNNGGNLQHTTAGGASVLGLEPGKAGIYINESAAADATFGSSLTNRLVITETGVSINKDAADPSAVLQVVSQTTAGGGTPRGFMMPSLTTTDRNAIPSPMDGLMIYNQDNKEFNYYNGLSTSWQTVGGGGSGWSLTGNAGTVNGTNFIGTTDNVPLSFRVNNINSGRIDNALENTFFGFQSGLQIPTGATNTGIGRSTLANTTTGQANTAIGSAALTSNVSGSWNTAVGRSAMEFNTGTGNSAFGALALRNNTSGNWNVAIGYNALNLLTTGGNNVAIGGHTLANTNAGNAVAIGYEAMRYNTADVSSENFNVAVGFAALRGSTTPANNTGNGNTAIGFRNLEENTTGALNSSLGINSLPLNTSGNRNSVNGAYAMKFNTTGSENVAVGFRAGNPGNDGAAPSGNITGTRNTYIGMDAGPSVDGLTNSAAIGFNAIVNSSNTIQLGNNTVTTVYAGTGTNATLVAGGLQITGGTLGAGRVLTSDASGNATWQPAGGGGWSLTGNAGINPATNFIGTTDAQPLRFATGVGGVERMRISETGTIGIGTLTPTAALEVVGNGLTGIRVSSNDPNGYAIAATNTGIGDVAGLFLATNPAGEQNNHGIYASADGAGSGIYASSGNSGTGSAAIFNNFSGANSSPVVQVLNSGTGPGIQIGSFTEVHNNFLSIKTAGGNLYKAGINFRHFDETDGFTIESDESINQLRFKRYDGSEKVAMVINRLDGQIGIGTLSPLAQFHLSGNGDTEWWKAAMFLSQTGASPRTYSFSVRNNGNFQIGDETANTERMVITPAGNIGIGTFEPGAKLEVAGQVKITGGTPGVGKVLTSDADGLATWQDAGGGASWSLGGNAGTVDGVPGVGTNYIGTTDDVPVNFMMNNSRAGRIDRINGATFLGYFSGNPANTGFGNTGIGDWALAQNSSGVRNTGIGGSALSANTIGNWNTALGPSLTFNTTGNDNTGLGAQALYVNTEGSGNTAVGRVALQNNTTGNANTAVGGSAGFANTTGSLNTFIGYNAGANSNATISNATAIGYNAQVNASNSMVLGDAVNVGIGITTPPARLTVVGTPSEPSIPNFTSTGTARIGVFGNEGLDIGKSEIVPYAAWMQSGYNGNSADPISLQPVGGNVGIGTVDPFVTFDVSNKVGIFQGRNNDPTFKGIGTPQWTRIGGNGGGLVFWGNDGADLDDNPQMVLGADGNFALGVLPFTNVKLTINGGGNEFAMYSDGTLSSYAGYFVGDVAVSEIFQAGTKLFSIDHPLDPENKILNHVSIESPDMMNVYNGNIITNGNGLATVELPDYFGALNKDFRYQLTVIGDFAQAIVFEKISNNRFVIKTDKPNIEVSWQVTGIRKDPFAEKNRIVPEEAKTGEKRGKYIHPEAYGLSRERGIQPTPDKSMNPGNGRTNTYERPNPQDTKGQRIRSGN
jgi:hypothetical protein